MAASSDDDEGAGISNKELAGMFSKMIASQMEGFKLLGEKIDSSSASTRVFLEQVMSKSLRFRQALDPTLPENLQPLRVGPLKQHPVA
jgi:hypothetical protein